MTDHKKITLGLGPAPDLASDLAEHMKAELPELLSGYVSSDVTWDVQVTMDPLTGATVDSAKVL